MKRSTLDGRIHVLKEKGILHSVGRGIYSLQTPQQYQPDTHTLKRLFKQLKKEFPFLEICAWDTRWLNEFMHHQPGRFYTLIEVEKDALSSVFYFLQEKRRNVYLDPSETILEQYVQENEATLVTSLVTEAPTQTIDAVTTTTLEKMLVDIYCNPIIFAAQQGQEREVIFGNAFDKYTVERAKLLRYAARRGKRKELQTFINHLENGQ